MGNAGGTEGVVDSVSGWSWWVNGPRTALFSMMIHIQFCFRTREINLLWTTFLPNHLFWFFLFSCIMLFAMLTSISARYLGISALANHSSMYVWVHPFTAFYTTKQSSSIRWILLLFDGTHEPLPRKWEACVLFRFGILRRLWVSPTWAGKENTGFSDSSCLFDYTWDWHYLSCSPFWLCT